MWRRIAQQIGIGKHGFHARYADAVTDTRATGILSRRQNQATPCTLGFHASFSSCVPLWPTFTTGSSLPGLTPASRSAATDWSPVPALLREPTKLCVWSTPETAPPCPLKSAKLLA